MAKWIWYPGSLELYHGMLLHNRRTHAKTYPDGKVRSNYYYPMWRVDSPKHNSFLFKEAEISESEVFEFHSNTDLSCAIIDGKSYPEGAKVELAPGKHKIELQGFKRDGFPAYYCKGNVFASDRSWLVSCDDDNALRHAGESSLYTDTNDDPLEFKFSYKKIEPVKIESVNGGILYDFGKESFGPITVLGEDGEVLIALGESYEEAVDYKFANCVINANIKNGIFKSESCAFRYLYFPDTDKEFTVFAELEVLPLENKGAFKCDNEEINTLWDICAYTMLLNSREAFFDGIKRDRWVWSGDAYQSYFVNYYLANDRDIVKRSIRMLRGANPITKHINTICDYTFYWIISIWEYYFHSADKDFVTDIYPEMLDMWKFIESRLDSDGMYERKPDDWVFIDWSTFDSNGPMCAEQMLLARANECMAKCAELNGDFDMSARCQRQFEFLKGEINKKYWCDSKGAFIDDYKSGKENVTRHAHIFALLFDYTSDERKESIIKNVIFNDSVTKITTPYFEFFELDAMCKIGSFKYMTDMLHSYWGGMLRLGATTIWEEFDPTKSGIEHYEMYGGKYEKSLCHAWGASPIYLLGKYALGVRPTDVGYSKYEVKPNLMCFGEIEGKVPTPNSEIYVKVSGGTVSVLSGIDGGTLVLGDKKYPIEKDKMLTVKI